MIATTFNQLESILLLGAHADDIEIGCGGTVLKLLRERPDLNVLWVVFSGDRDRAQEARSSAGFFLKGAKRPKIIIKRFKGSYFPFHGEAVKHFFEELKRMFKPDLVFTHYREDRHQDHRLVSDLTWNTFRDHVILEYEIPKYDGDLGNPNFYVQLDEGLCRRKSDHICKFFPSQRNHQWFSPATFLGLTRLRGIECASKTRHAEAFYCRKLVF